MPPPTKAERHFAQALTAQGFAGTVSIAPGDRVVMATDNSIYQLLPGAVVYPRDEADLALIARLLDQPEFHGVTVRPRGGGTGTNGQSLGGGITVDCSRHMTRILDIDVAARRVRVQPGVIKDQLNAALRPHGLFFAPELSTSSRATIGGMISTDACGQGSCAYGKTSTHVLSLRAALIGGEVIQTQRAPHVPGTGRSGAVLETLDTLSRDQAELIAQRFPKLNRTLTGYDLAHIRQGDSIDPAAVICGSEGTLALISEATLNLLPIPAATALLLVFYPDFQAALRDAREMASLGATSVETIDSRVLGLAREEPGFAAVAHLFPVADAAGVNIVEFTGDDAGALTDHVTTLRDRLAAGPGRLAVTQTQGADVARVWGLRKASVGLLGRARGSKRPLPFVEDCAVPPERLEPFIAGFRAILDREGLDYGMFGHVDAGVLHVRPALDLTDPAQEVLIRRITDEVVALVHQHGGLLWGEHGKGVRSEYVPEVFGPLYPALQQIKAAFDPRNQLNPGKIATPDDSALWQIDGVPTRGQMDRQVPEGLRADHASAFACNGNGACFNRDAGDVMCPSYKATGDRRHSPKGRASLMREWLRQGGPDGAADPDFEADVKQAMDGCLSCAACTTQCPIRVDVPKLRAGFLQSYHARHRRPLRHYALDQLEALLPYAARLPRLANLMTQGPGAALMHRIGLTALPALPLHRPPLDQLRDLETLDPARDVVLVPDAFTRFFEPQLVADLAEVLDRLGHRLRVAPYRPSGKARQVLGRVRGAAAQARAQADLLRRIDATGTRMVQIEPAITACYKTDYPEGTPRPLSPQELLATLVNDTVQAPPMRVRLLPHCSERVQGAAGHTGWREVFARFGITLHIPATGCCGMAGMWGHETVNRATSETIFAQSWQDATAPATGPEPDIILATGYSCRCQSAKVANRALQHPISLLRQLMAAG
ncbi:FAD-binding and (Fe-S)-binding domain-containing protein [Citreicella sp. C3M06]|uniref:FAD-binding and (Fe-S)-binding domain-containing protein n=1 Tax=Citreicella sp. C3M06 TaxID=2841564 RepID=UPI0020902C83|nr:FAD-binding and (Fe-S)-binding domain-containing protein [Citreicella sp. C3M06]